jgi:transcriptional regulator with XRE-family HTH domain
MNKKLTLDFVSTRINGKEFRKQRHAAGKTLRDISSLCGISISYLCDIELGRRIAKNEVARKLVEALGK